MIVATRRSAAPPAGSKPLVFNYLPSPFDVICAKGRKARDHTGNRRFRLVIDMNLARYQRTHAKICKAMIVSDIVDSIRGSSPNGGFIKMHEGQWYEVGDHVVREKITQCFRDRLHTEYRSSSRAKSARRKSPQESDTTKIEDDEEELNQEELNQTNQASQYFSGLTPDPVLIFETANESYLSDLKTDDAQNDAYTRTPYLRRVKRNSVCAPVKRRPFCAFAA
jgi:hypothetical protein